MGAAAKHAFEFLCNGDATTHDDDVDVVAGTFEKDVAHIATDDVAFYAEAVGSLTNLMEYGLVEYLGQFVVGIEFHVVVSWFCGCKGNKKD